MSQIELMNSLKDIVNFKCDIYKNKIAFIEKDNITEEFFKISYAKLKEDINGLGTYMLKKLNLSQQKIGIIGSNSYKWYETYMATTCGVGVIVPLNKELSEDEIAKIINFAEIKCLVYSIDVKEKINNIRKILKDDIYFIEMSKEITDKQVLSYDEIIKKGKILVEKGERIFIDAEIDREKMCCLLFESNFTKGIMLSHKNLVTSIYAFSNIANGFDNYTAFSILPIHHIYEFMIDYLYMTSIGGTVAISKKLDDMYQDILEIKPDFIILDSYLIEKIIEKIEKNIRQTNKETLMNFISKITLRLNKLGIEIRNKMFKQINDSLGGNLKYVLCGSTPLDKELAYKLESYGYKLLQSYGLPEAPILTATSFEQKAFGTVGKAVYGVDVRIDLTKNVDENSNVGEIIAKGDSIMLGYYQNEKATKEVITKGWFYTGDVGYFDLRGNLVVTGKRKNIIITSTGKKIYPEEIEKMINKIPLVKESVVYPQDYENKKIETIITARVMLDEEYIKNKYKENRPTDLSIYNTIWDEIKKINKNFVSYKAIKKLEIKDHHFIKTTTIKKKI